MRDVVIFDFSGVVERKFTFNIHKNVCGAQELHKRLRKEKLKELYDKELKI